MRALSYRSPESVKEAPSESKLPANLDANRAYHVLEKLCCWHKANRVPTSPLVNPAKVGNTRRILGFELL